MHAAFFRFRHRHLPRMLFAAATIALAHPSLSDAQGKEDDAHLRRRLLGEVREMLRGYDEDDRRSLGNRLVEQFLQRKDPESALELAMDIDLRDGWVFGRIAETFAENGDMRRAVSIVSLPSDSATRESAIISLASTTAQRAGFVLAREMLALITSPALRRQAALQVAQSVYAYDAEVAGMLREIFPGVLADTSSEGRTLALQVAVAMANKRDLSGLRTLRHSSDLHNLMSWALQAANSLRERGDVLADSVFAIVDAVIAAAPDSASRQMLQVSLWQQDGKRNIGAGWRRKADSITTPAVRAAYLGAVARGQVNEGSSAMAESIAEYLFQRADTNAARQILMTTASTLANGYWSRAVSSLDVPLRMIRRIEATEPRNRRHPDTYTIQALALLPRISMDNARQLASDPAFPGMRADIQDGVINSLLNVDVHAGLALALLLPDSTRADQYLRQVGERFINAGLLEAGLNVASRMRTLSQRAVLQGAVAQKKVQHGDTTGVRAIIVDALHGIDMRRDQYALVETIVPAALRVGLRDELLAMAQQLPVETRAFLLVAFMEKTGGH